jgi:multidrug efflux pump
VTVAAAISISGFVAVTLSPALCARVLRGRGGVPERGLKRVLALGSDRLTAGYGRALRPVLARPWLWVAIGAAWVALGAGLLRVVDEELIPQSDRGVVLAWTQAPEGSTVEYMDRYQRQAERVLLANPDVARLFSIVALGIGTPGLVNEGLVIATLVPEAQRSGSIDDVMREMGNELREVPGIQIFPFLPAPLRGFQSAPVEITIQGPDVFELARMGDEIERAAGEQGGFARLRGDLFLNKPQLDVVIDREKASDLGVSVRDIATALQILLGGFDISTFKLAGETYNVVAQLRRPERSNARDLASLFVRGKAGLIPLWSLVEPRETVGPRALPHYDRFRSLTLTSELAGIAQGEALQRIKSIADGVVPDGSGYTVRFSGEAERFFESGNALVFAYGLALLAVYLVLSAQFESFVHPVTIMVAVALSFTGALVALVLTDTTLNLFSKIGLVMLVGLVTKNSILIVEFANQLREQGRELTEAIFEAARTRFRPILMTALSTAVGILPIALGVGAGGESRAPLGIAVVGGVLFSTVLTFFVVPATYLTIERARLRAAQRRQRDEASRATAVAAGS